jgi:hypothetical protein
MRSHVPFVVAAMARQSAEQQHSNSESLIQMCRMTLKVKIKLFASTVKLNLSGLIWNPEIKKKKKTPG